MTSRTSTLTLTGSTSTSTADNPSNHKSDMIKAWNYTDLLTGNGNFPIPFPSHSRTSKNRNASTQTQFHRTTEYEGEAKDAITKSDKTKRRKVAGQFQAGRESEKQNTDSGRAPGISMQILSTQPSSPDSLKLYPSK